MSGQSVKLEELRRHIDGLDKQLLELLAERMATAKAIGKYKRDHRLSALDEERWQAVIQARLETAKRLGLSKDFVAKLYNLIHEYALRVESGGK